MILCFRLFCTDNSWMESKADFESGAEMIEKVKETISKFNMLDSSDNVLVGLSGGADSISLLICLKELEYKVTAMHINHNLRGDESLRDERFCEELCKSLGVPLIIKSIDVKKYCLENKIGTEEGARELRYKAFFEAEADKICTAHTLSDSVETMLINLTRGTALKGLCGIPCKRDNIVRPLIECTREEVENFLNNRGIGYVTDSTNNSDEYTRNKIRHRVIPEIEKITNEQNGSFYKNINKTFQSLKEDESYLNYQASSLLERSKICEGEYDLNLILSAHDAVKNRAFMLLLKKYNVQVSAAKLEYLKSACEEGRKINLKRDLYAAAESEKLYFSKGTKSSEIREFSRELDFENVQSGVEKAVFYDKKIEIRLINVEKIGVNFNNMFTKKYIDYDKIKGRIFLRNRRGGDKIRLPGRGLTKTVKKLFNESVPLDEREKLMLLCDDEGVLFIEGFGCDERVCPNENTKRFLKIEIS